MFNAYNVTLLVKPDKCAMTLIIEFFGAYLTRLWSYMTKVSRLDVPIGSWTYLEDRMLNAESHSSNPHFTVKCIHPIKNRPTCAR